MAIDIEAQVIKITAKTLGIEEGKITSKSNFINDLGADSLDQVELMMAFETEFFPESNEGIPDEDASKLATIDAVVQYIKQKMAA